MELELFDEKPDKKPKPSNSNFEGNEIQFKVLSKDNTCRSIHYGFGYSFRSKYYDCRYSDTKDP